MGENPKNVFNVGCPRIDLITNSKKIERNLLNNIFKKYRGVGPKLDLNKDFLLVLQHPVTTESSKSRQQIEITLRVLLELKIQTIMLWPNIDAGSQGLSKGIRTFREKHKPEWLHLFKNLPIEIYINLMRHTSCLIGNSSSGIRDSAILGVPVVNIGSRQKDRLKGKNVITTDNNYKQVFSAVTKQLKIKKYKKNMLYGDGKSGKKIANILSKTNIEIQKKIFY
jgi:UDP-hydrolysing UDP-N-acetyl-D-glucosamine 2-epimerase